MNKEIIWEIRGEKGPVIATAIHDGHKLRPEVKELSAVDKIVRFREEDPFTGSLTDVGNLQIVGTHSRFEVDLNRPREKAVYKKPEDAWGLEVCRFEPSQDLLDRSLAEYDLFYKEVYKIFSDIEIQFGKFVVFDLHSYNYLREGPDKPPANPLENPEVNIGTGSVNRKIWAPLVDRFISDLSDYDLGSRKLDVRENIKFKGGEFSRWIHNNFPESGCSLSIEFKKFFMNEWSGEPDLKLLDGIRSALQSTIPGVHKELIKLGARW